MTGTIDAPVDGLPVDLAAEQSVLGAMLLNNAVVLECAGALDVGDFYRPAHQAVYDAVLDLCGRGEPADPITVAAELERRGDLGRVGGAPYLHTLIATVPTAVNAGYYAEIVAAKARARRLVVAGTRLAARAGLPDVDLDQLVDEHQAAIGDAGPPGCRGLPDAVLLDELLSEPDAAVRYRVDRVWPMGGRVLFAAQFKAGKTTADHNLVRSLVDGEPFLGEFDVTVPAGRVAVLDTELDREMLKRWLRAQGIRNAGRVALYSLRGQLSAFNILDTSVRRQWAEQLRALDVSVLVLDCLRPVLDSLGLDENADAGRFLVAFDELLVDADVGEAVVIHHMGHAGERSRGSSRLRDWPDAEWKLVREQSDEDQPAAPRYFSAYGRDVDVAEAALHFDPDTRHLVLAGTGNRRDTAARKAVTAVLAWLEDNPGSSGYAVDKALAETEGQKAVRAALSVLVSDGRLTTARGARNATLYYPSTSSPRPPRHDLVDKVAQPHLVTSSTSSIGRGDQVVVPGTGSPDLFATRSTDEVRSFSEPMRTLDDD